MSLNVGLLGFGFSGSTFHTPFLEALDDFCIKKVMSSKPQKVHQMLPNVHVVEDIDEIIQDNAIELVVITTPNPMHFLMAKKSLEAGKHVVIEKPMVVASRQAEKLIEIASSKNLLLSVYHNRRWDSDFLTVQKLIENDKLGEINTYKARFDRFRPVPKDRWKEQAIQGGGTLYDLGSHLIDQALVLFGWPHFVQADVFAQRTSGVADDYFHVTLGYERTRVILHSGSMVLQPGPRFEIHGNKGSFIKYGTDPQENNLKQGVSPLDDTFGIESSEHSGLLFTNEQDDVREERVDSLAGRYIDFYQGVYNSIRYGSPAPVSSRDALAVIKTIEAALTSSREKKTVFL